ncbi:MAG: hypothetical protein PW789_09740 [Edaphobacter sp.]|uniref:hypothetical protein n=1 Tax=Edaphobacter sp. TaxID=1934404 RepID=UPI00239349B7|nr:hypothetical protein [Edaphobacter sp.]MDE1176876.1 hypothetical protein [Edaphobacter sp.]
MLRLTRGGLGAVAVLAALGALKGDWRSPSAHANTRMAHLPRITVWAWERREDMRALDPATTALAYLDRTIVIDGRGPAVVPRREPMLLPASSALVRIPVVRIETGAGAVLDDAAADRTAEEIVAAIRPAESAALQIDFDAKLSERTWYRGVLQRVRKVMPAAMPLSITALGSWCSYDSAWLRSLPVDEAVPMLFRMEPDRRRFAPNGRREVANDFMIREPVCMGSVGISTREAWPRNLAGRRVYVFPDGGWQRDGLQETVKELW